MRTIREKRARSRPPASASVLSPGPEVKQCESGGVERGAGETAAGCGTGAPAGSSRRRGVGASHGVLAPTPTTLGHTGGSSGAVERRGREEVLLAVLGFPATGGQAATGPVGGDAFTALAAPGAVVRGAWAVVKIALQIRAFGLRHVLPRIGFVCELSAFHRTPPVRFGGRRRITCGGPAWAFRPEQAQRSGASLPTRTVVLSNGQHTRAAQSSAARAKAALECPEPGRPGRSPCRRHASAPLGIPRIIVISCREVARACRMAPAVARQQPRRRDVAGPASRVRVSALNRRSPGRPARSLAGAACRSPAREVLRCVGSASSSSVA